MDIASAVRKDMNFIAEVGTGVWVMDDHRWAFFAWESAAAHSASQQRYSLIHADYHYDACNDFESDEQIASLQAVIDLQEIERLVRADEMIKKDSFIAPAVIRGLLKQVDFYCLQDDTEDGLDESLLLRFACSQRVHGTAEELAAQEVASPLIFDLCLDLFNKSDVWEEGDLWSDVEILDFLERMSEHVRQAEWVTLSYSFGWSGTENDTIRLANLVLPKILGYRRTHAA